jgi:hypothetical protein
VSKTHGNSVTRNKRDVASFSRACHWLLMFDSDGFEMAATVHEIPRASECFKSLFVGRSEVPTF